MKHFYILVIALFMVNSTMAQWTVLSSGTTEWLNSVYFTDDSTGYAGGGTFLKTTDGGTTWSEISIGVPYLVSSIDFPSPDTGYVACFSHDIVRTTDAGATWTPYLGYNIEGALQTVYFTDNNTGYTAGNYEDTSTGLWCDIVKTTDGGITWNVIAQLWDRQIYSLFFTDSDTGYGAGDSGIIIKTIDGGTSWTVLPSGTIFNLRSVFFTDVNTGYVVGEGGKILKTANGGTAWTEIWSGKDWIFQSVFFTSGDTGYIVGHDYPDINNIILKTVNGGISWAEQPSGINIYLLSVFFPSANTGYIVGGDGTILKTTNGGGPPVGINEKPATLNSLKIYPNPSSDKITVKTSVAGNLSIQNLHGQELLRQTIKEPSTQINISILPSGAYFVKIWDEQTMQVGKVFKK